MRRTAGGRGDPGRQRRNSVHPSNKGEEYETLFDPAGPMVMRGRHIAVRRVIGIGLLGPIQKPFCAVRHP
jgi:hypothetical protein